MTYQDLRDISFILNQPHAWGIKSRIINFNRIPVTIHVNSTLKTKDNNVLWEGHSFQRNVRYCHQAHPMYFDYNEFKQFNYPYGGFDLILHITIPETETDITIVHHGYFIGIFAIIFNPYGERI